MQLNSKLLNYDISGEGPVIVLLHGYLSSLHYWDNIKSKLKKDHTVISIDLLGFGDSPKPNELSYGYNDHINWIRQTLEHCGVTQPAIFGGHSMGALLALRYASTYPMGVGKLVLINMPLFRTINEARQELAGTSIVYKIGLYYGLHRLVWPVMRNAVSRIIMRKAIPVAFRGMETYMFASTASARNGSLKNVIEDQRSLHELEQLRTSTTLVIGKKDRSIYRENLHTITHTPLLDILITNTSHHTPIEDPSLSIELLKT